MQFGKTYTREFFKDFKLHSSFGLVQFRSSLKNLLVHVFFQIALETILLPILILKWKFVLKQLVALGSVIASSYNSPHRFTAQ